MEFNKNFRNYKNNARPGQRRQTLDDTFREVLCWEVAIFQEGAGFYFDVADGT
jgi:hypothetical protein